MLEMDCDDMILLNLFRVTSTTFSDILI